MVVNKILLTVVMLAYCAKLGVSLQCYKCFGSADECNRETAKKTTCLDGQDRCTSVITTKDGKTSVTFGCGDENGCVSAENTCEAAEKNVRTTCEAKCCQSDTCNTPPKKVNNLRCFECQSAQSMEHCIQNSKDVTCKSSDENRCAKFTSELVMGDQKLMVYRKGCRKEANCDKGKDFFMQECGDDDTCENLCCKDNLCNAGSSFTISVAIMFASILLAIFFM